MTGRLVTPARFPRVEITPPAGGDDDMWSGSCQSRSGVEVFVHVSEERSIASIAVAIDIDSGGKGIVRWVDEDAHVAIARCAGEWGFVQTVWARRVARELPDRAAVQELLEFVLNGIEAARSGGQQ